VDLLGIVLLGLAMLVGIFGTVVPLLPGLPIVWAAALVYALLSDPGASGWLAFAVITAIAVLGLVVGTLLPHRRVVAAGVPRASIVAGVIAGVIGFFVIPVVGLPLGAAVGILLAEKSRLNDWGAAAAATKTLLIGFGLGALVQFAAGVAMMATWVVWVLID
jgi:uncharacterized protein